VILDARADLNCSRLTTNGTCRRNGEIWNGERSAVNSGLVRLASTHDQELQFSDTNWRWNYRQNNAFDNSLLDDGNIRIIIIVNRSFHTTVIGGLSRQSVALTASMISVSLAFNQTPVYSWTVTTLIGLVHCADSQPPKYLHSTRLNNTAAECASNKLTEPNHKDFDNTSRLSAVNIISTQMFNILLAVQRFGVGLMIERSLVWLPAGALSSQLGQLSLPSLRGS